jgi:hypothetical protein
MHAAHWIYERGGLRLAFVAVVIVLGIWLAALATHPQNRQEMFDRLYGFLD